MLPLQASAFAVFFPCPSTSHSLHSPPSSPSSTFHTQYTCSFLPSSSARSSSSSPFSSRTSSFFATRPLHMHSVLPFCPTLDPPFPRRHPPSITCYFGPGGGGFLGVGTTEILVCVVVGWIVLGPKELIKLARSSGKLLGQAKTYLVQLREEVSKNVNMEDVRQVQQTVMSLVDDVQEAVSLDTRDKFKEQMARLNDPNQVAPSETTAKLDSPSLTEQSLITATAAATTTSTTAAPTPAAAATTVNSITSPTSTSNSKATSPSPSPSPNVSGSASVAASASSYSPDTAFASTTSLPLQQNTSTYTPATSTITNHKNDKSHHANDPKKYDMPPVLSSHDDGKDGFDPDITEDLEYLETQKLILEEKIQQKKWERQLLEIDAKLKFKKLQQNSSNTSDKISTSDKIDNNAN